MHSRCIARCVRRMVGGVGQSRARRMVAQFLVVCIHSTTVCCCKIKENKCVLTNCHRTGPTCMLSHGVVWHNIYRALHSVDFVAHKYNRK